MTVRPLNPPPEPSAKAEAASARRNGLAYRITHNDAFLRFVAWAASLAERLTLRLGPARTKKLAVAVIRLVGPLFPEHRVAVANVAAAFPDKSAHERRRIVRGCWENLARVFIEVIVLDRLAEAFDPSRPGQGSITAEGLEHFDALRRDNGPAVIIGAHLANWEVAAIVLAKLGVRPLVPFRSPTNPYIARRILERRDRLMGGVVDDGPGAAPVIAAAMKRGGRLAVLIDQRPSNAAAVPFFGRPALTDPMSARFARLFDCPVYTIRVVRLPDDRLSCELVPVELPRDSEGQIDVDASLVVLNGVIEGWVREHPEQWLWLHNRWKR